MQELNKLNSFFIKLKCENSYIFFQKSNFSYFTNFFLSYFWFDNFFKSKYSTLQQKTYINLILNLLIFKKSSVRFLFSLPQNGQRTWSNANSAKKNNTFLIQFKLKQYKTLILGNINLNNLKNLIFLNFLNWLWKIMWIKDWIFLYKKNKNLLLKNKFIKKKKLTLHKLLNYQAQNKRIKQKTQINFNYFFNFIGLDSLINLK